MTAHIARVPYIYKEMAHRRRCLDCSRCYSLVRSTRSSIELATAQLYELATAQHAIDAERDPLWAICS